MNEQKKLISELFAHDKFILVILDACRYDCFERCNTVEGKLEKVKSSGSATEEWLRKTWTDHYPGVAYVSGNPHITSKKRRNGGSWVSTRHFEYVEDVWSWGFKIVSNPFYGFMIAGKTVVIEIEAIPADEVVKGVEKVIEKGYKKIVAHFMQPHSPYIGKTPGILGKYTDNFDLLTLQYKDNLRYVIENGVKPLLKYSDFEIIVTADHGELLGEGGYMEHIDGSDAPKLKEVPWFSVQPL